VSFEAATVPDRRIPDQPDTLPYDVHLGQDRQDGETVLATQPVRQGLSEEHRSKSRSAGSPFHNL
jgi:hypothetical protein